MVVAVTHLYVLKMYFVGGLHTVRYFVSKNFENNGKSLFQFEFYF